MSDFDPKDMSWAAPGDDPSEVAAASHLRKYLDGDAYGTGRPTPEDLEVVGIFGELTGTEPLPRAAWERLRAMPPVHRRPRTRWGPFALAAAVALAVGVGFLLRGHPAETAVPAATAAELAAFGEALASSTAAAPRARADALDQQARAQLERVVASWEGPRAL